MTFTLNNSLDLKKLGWYECKNGRKQSKLGGQRFEGKRTWETIKFRFHLNICRTVSKLESFTDDEREYIWSWMYETRECKNYENARKDRFNFRTGGSLANLSKDQRRCGFFTCNVVIVAFHVSWRKWGNLHDSPISPSVHLQGGSSNVKLRKERK